MRKGFLTAEGRVEDNVLVPEMGVNLASVAPRKGGGWVAPLRRIGRISQHIRRLTSTSEEPELYMIRVPLEGINTTSVGVELVPVCVGAPGWFRTA